MPNVESSMITFREHFACNSNKDVSVLQIFRFRLLIFHSDCKKFTLFMVTSGMKFLGAKHEQLSTWPNSLTLEFVKSWYFF